MRPSQAANGRQLRNILSHAPGGVGVHQRIHTKLSTIARKKKYQWRRELRRRMDRVNLQAVESLRSCYREGSKTIWPQSQSSLCAASPTRELCLRMVIPNVSPAPRG